MPRKGIVRGGGKKPSRQNSKPDPVKPLPFRNKLVYYEHVYGHVPFSLPLIIRRLCVKVSIANQALAVRSHQQTSNLAI